VNSLIFYDPKTKRPPWGPMTFDPSDQVEGRAQLQQQVHLQVNPAQREEHAENREPDENPQNLSAEIQRSQPAEGEHQ